MLKNKKIKIIGLLIIIILMSLVLGMGVGAATGLTKKISAVYRHIKIYVDGKELKYVEEPFILEDKGITMVPLRLISEALGKPVTWVEKNSAIYIGTIPEGADLETEIKDPTPIEKLTVLRNVGPFYEYRSRNFLIAKRPFSGGVATNLTQKPAELVLELKGHYSYLEGYLGVDDETMNSSSGFRIIVYGDDVEKYSSPVIRPADYPRYLKLDVKGVKLLRITVLKEDIKTVGGEKVGEYENVMAVLADFQFHK